MTKRYLSLPAFGLLAAMALPAAAQDADTVVATVNGTDITVGHMIVAHGTLPEQYQSLPANVLFEGILSQLISQTVLSQSLEGELPKRAMLSLDNERRSVTAGEAIELVLQGAITEETVQSAYAARATNFAGAEEYNASHILVPTEEEALAVIADLEAGADFAAVAQEKSTGPSGPNGGQLGWFGSGAMVPSFEAAVIALGVGEVSEPVQTQFGWHVITLNDVRTQDMPPIDTLRPELEAELREAAVSARIEALTEAATIENADTSEIDPEILKDLSLVQ
jgi:peptidyl-prolyl cis-trans isomerase C